MVLSDRKWFIFYANNNKSRCMALFFNFTIPQRLQKDTTKKYFGALLFKCGHYHLEKSYIFNTCFSLWIVRKACMMIFTLKWRCALHTQSHTSFAWKTSILTIHHTPHSAIRFHAKVYLYSKFVASHKTARARTKLCSHSAQ